MGAALCLRLAVTMKCELADFGVKEGILLQNGNKHNISIVNFHWRRWWNMNARRAMEANKFCNSFMSWAWKRPWGELWRQQEEHRCNYAFSEYSTHSSLLFCAWKCSHESSSMLLDEAVTSTAALCLFYGCTQILIHHYLSVIMEILGELLGLL